MTRKELLNLPVADFKDEIPLLDELFFIPTMRKHDSGYRCIEVIGIRYERDLNLKSYLKRTGNYEYAKKIATYSDVINWNGMHKYNNQSWAIDVPSDCNCMRLFVRDNLPRIRILWKLSDFEFEIVGEDNGK